MVVVGAVGRCRGVQPREHLDDDHATAAAWTGRLVAIDGGIGGLAVRFCHGEELAGAADVGGARAFGEQAVVADAVQAFWHHGNEEAADELEGLERHVLVAIAPLDAVVLPPEGDALLVAGDQAAVGDGDAVGVARQIVQQRLRSAERTLGVDDSLCLAERREIGCEALGIGERGEIAEEAQATGLVGSDELLQQQPPEQVGEHAHGRKNPGRQDTQRWPSGEMPPPGANVLTLPS